MIKENDLKDIEDILEMHGVTQKHEEVSLLIEEIRRFNHWFEGFESTVEAAAAHMRRPKGGQQVPFHGGFAYTTPSVIKELEWWVRAMKSSPSSI